MRTDIDERKDEIIEWLKAGASQAECARRLDCKIDTLVARLKKWDVVHLKNQGNKGVPQPYAKNGVGGRRHVSDYLKVDGPTITSHRLKLRLWRDGYKEKKCESCGITEWQGQPAPLELDHINGNHWDNRLENLRVLCPNCHALTPTNSGKNKKKKK